MTYVIGISILLLAPGAAQAVSLETQVGVATAAGSDWVANDLDVAISGVADAVANCQILLAVNAIVVNVASVESLALINTRDELDIGLRPGINGASRGYLSPAHNGTATCEQDIGPIRVAQATQAGWGEAAPVAQHADALAQSVGAPQLVPIIPGPADLDSILQTAVSVAGLSDVIANSADIAISGDSNAVANCQILVGWDVLAINAGHVKQKARIVHNDSVNVDFPILVPVRSIESAESKLLVPYPPQNHAEVGVASCKQTIESLTLVVGDGDRFPPQS